ncbi:hypothetical protein AQS8620_00853 [Aquimixticola soesokkakensis]|uniref:Uncharacterized protein n=1 Tax=Aquimixticola soesokkakensis TaxID=1519096 RepID=A0A1Y5RY72_9RHOB|nr:hypothetical protein [Aquimixticola soesokkakensis]SLN27710.1 hypothetical protein AQS8620_00853 [Aquimixticola soesokkakensis]
MTDKKKPKKKERKDSQLIVRITASDRDRFVSLCDELDTSAAREIRRFIRDFLQEHDGQPSGQDLKTGE